MAKQRSRLRDRKRRRREERKLRSRVRSALASSARGRLRAAARGPVRECLLTEDWRETTAVSVILSRDGPHGIACVALLVDLGCLGIKDCFVADDLDEADYAQLVSTIGRDVPVLPADPALALKIALAGAAWAAGLGFRPHGDWHLAHELFGDVDVAACTEDVPCGVDGRPNYLPGPDDDVESILAQLEASVGPDGFDVPLAGPPMDGLKDELPDVPGSQGEDWDDSTPAELALATGVDVATAATWLRVRRAESHAVDGANAWASERWGEPLVVAALAECLLWRGAFGAEADDGEESADGDEGSGGDPDVSPPRPLSDAVVRSLSGVHMPWFVFTWRHDPNEEHGDDWPVVPIAQAWLASGPEVDDDTRRFAEAACRRPFGIYSVRDVWPGRGMRLRCVFTGAEHEVLERAATLTATRGGLLYARIVPMDGIEVMSGCSSAVLPPKWHEAFADLRERIASGRGPLDEDDLADHALELREAWIDATEAAYDRAPPRVQNTDGEPLVLVTLAYELACPPREAFDALCSLAHHADADELLRDAETDRDGGIVSIDVPWSRAGDATQPARDNTILGRLTITPGRLRVEVNSEARAARIRALVDERLGARARCLAHTSRPAAELMRASRERPGADDAAARLRREHAERMKDPELRAALEEFMRRQWASWFDEPVPMLRGRTPREAARDPEGRELLEALLCDFEWNSRRGTDPLLAPDVAALRRELGM